MNRLKAMGKWNITVENILKKEEFKLKQASLHGPNVTWNNDNKSMLYKQLIV